MKKLLVLGSAGMAGHMIYYVLRETGKYIITDVSRSQKVNDTTILLDVMDFNAVEVLINKNKPDIIINGIGLLIKQSEERPADAILLNSYFPHFLHKMGNQYNFKLIHLTTDCVFSGLTGGYLENSFRDGDTIYARTRALGEIINDRDLSIRTSLVGPELNKNGSGLLNWFIMQTGQISGYSKTFWTGVTTLELAKAIDQFIEQGITGLYNFVPDYKISKYELLTIFKQFWNQNITINDDPSFVSDKSLICKRSDFKYTVHSYYQMIKELSDWMELNKDKYLHYYT